MPIPQLIPHQAAPTRILLQPAPAPGAWNMAVDEMLLDAAHSTPRCTIRWYRWSEPTISLGYFQDAGFLHESQELSRLPVVRRLSGGGALLHHHELTYACILPAGHPLARKPPDLYTAVHQRIAAVLARNGFPVQLGGERDVSRGQEFLCFSRRDQYDVLLDGFKVLGSAQRRRKGAILQHGSLVLRKSDHAPRFPGIIDLASSGATRSATGPVDLNPGEFMAELAGEMALLFNRAGRNESLSDEALSAAEMATAESLRASRYATLTRRVPAGAASPSF